LQDIERRIRITIHDQPTMRAGMGTVTQFLLDQFTAMGAHLGRVAGVDQDDCSASFCRFADRHTNELRPRYIHDAFAHSAPASHSHLLRFKVFKNNDLIRIDQCSAALVRKIRASVGYPFVDVIERLFPMPVLVPFLGVFGCIFQRLSAFQVSLIRAVEVGIIDLLAVRQRGKGHESDIHAGDLFGWRQVLRFRLTRDAGVPLAGCGSTECDGLGRAFYGPMQDNRHRANFREDEPIAVKPHAIAILRVGDTVVAPEALEAWIARIVSPFFYTAKEGLKGQINALCHVLQHLAMHQLERWSRFLPLRQHGFRLIPGERNALLIRITTGRKGLVVDPSALFQHRIQDTPLAVRQIDAVFEGFSHIFSIAYCHLKRNVCSNQSSGLKPLKRMKGLYPTAKARGVYALSP
jgi:hypothetical protein